MAAANSAALTAPAWPIAKVATGTPAGICTIDSRLSRPRRVRLSTGTPRTGSGVNAALFAAEILGLADPTIAAALDIWRRTQTDAVADRPDSR